MLASVFCFSSSAVIADSSIDFGVRLEKVTTQGEFICADSVSIMQYVADKNVNPLPVNLYA